MYPLEWIERLKLGRAASGAQPMVISPVVLSLGLTSLLTDISSEMVNSLLPAYVVLHLHLSPLQFGVIDGLYNGFAIALLSLVAGYHRRSERPVRRESPWRAMRSLASANYCCWPSAPPTPGSCWWWAWTGSARGSVPRRVMR